MPLSSSSQPDVSEALLWGLPIERIRSDVSRGDGDEIGRGRIFSPRSSTALAINAFGPFLERASALPPLPGLDDTDWVPLRVEAEAKLPFPWSKGSLVGVPNLDLLIETKTAVIGIESKRFEPWDSKRQRPPGRPLWSERYSAHAWGEGLRGYTHVRDASIAADRAGALRFRHLDEAQLVKHAFALHTAIQPRERFAGKAAILAYIYAEPRADVSGRIIAESAHALHRSEVAGLFADVANDSVRLLPVSYRELLGSWSAARVPQLRAHAAAVKAFFDDNI
jgi:hypothetical protein